MDVDKCMEWMSKGIVLLEYISLNSGDTKIREMTLCPVFIPKKNQIFTENFKRHDQNDKIICYDIEFQKWDDISKDSMVNWKKLTPGM